MVLSISHFKIQKNVWQSVYVTVSLQIFPPPPSVCVSSKKKKKKILKEEKGKRNEEGKTGRKKLACGDAGLANQGAGVISAEGVAAYFSAASGSSVRPKRN